MIHGGDTITYKDEFNGEIIDFSSNINPLGVPEKLKSVMADAFHELFCYPDINYRELKANVSEYLGCSSKEVIVGSGAIEIINNMCLMFKRIVAFTPCFSEYIKRPLVLSKEVCKIPLNKNFEIDLELLKSKLEKGDLLILGNPNNPTGLRIQESTLKNVYEIVKEKGVFLLLDEAFFEFCPNDYDSIKIFKDAKNICVIRAATKFFALPGIRLGYAFAPFDFVEEYQKIESPWSINSYANAAARCIFKDEAYIKKTKEYIEAERKYLFDKLSKIDWIKVYESHTDFMLIKLLEYDEDIVFDKFIKNGIMIRKASSFEGLDKNYIRIAVKDHESNEKLIGIFERF